MRSPAGSLYRLGWRFAGLFAAGFALWAAAWTWSDLIDAEGFTRLLEPAGSTQSPYAPERDWRRLTTASRINPLRAEYPHHQAQASRYLPTVGSQHEGSIPSAADQSIKSFERALSLRPHWGVAWAELAVARSANKERSAATLRALDRALAFAPSEPFVRRTELRIGLSLWDRLDSHWRERVMAAARYLVEHEPRFAVGVAVSAGWEDRLRPLLTKEDDVAYLDRRLEDKKIWEAAQ